MNWLKQRLQDCTLSAGLAAIGVAVSGVVVAMALGWLLLAQVNFSYGIWHDYGGIEEAIELYGPSNHSRHGFHLTTREQRIGLFAEINRAIHQGGEGLEFIMYEAPGHPPQLLLTDPEVVHLQDVARLVEGGLTLAWAALFVWLFSWGVITWRFLKPPALKKQLLALVSLVAVTAAIVLLIGPVKVFYALHDCLFPADNPWFFYYQESLMSTMMHAPYLFGWIALEWLAVTIILFVLIQCLAGKAAIMVQRRRRKPQG